MTEHASTFIADSVEPQYIAPAGALPVELELRAGNVEAAREAAEKAIDQLEYCSDDAARMALISAAATAVEAEGAERARDLGDAAELEAAQLRAELGAARTAAAAETTGRAWSAPTRRRRRRSSLAPATTPTPPTGRPPRPRVGRAAASLPGGDVPAARGRGRAARGEREAAGAAAAKALATAEELGSEWLAAEVAG